MPTDKSNADMLYSILKQLDLKYIDWKIIAEECKISNGHAARMRYHRFRQTMENIQPSKRGPRAPKGSSKRQKLSKCKGALSDDDDEDKYFVKPEEEDSKLGIKDEPKTEAWSDDDIPLSRVPRVKREIKEETMEDLDREVKAPEREMDVEKDAEPVVEAQVLLKKEPLVWS
ncbi:uncharacterized protein J3D65DRAFT_660638 [Phyllosticta citribraziliensis]|uniref:Myb-like DNA-binding domain-containing protein n=1 Tax=Phyllosticta citribraziliensis TaxID=989973 RepID=A0ABR1LIC5_9PEZI